MERQPDAADVWQSGRFPVSAGKPVWILPYDRQSEIPVEWQPDEADAWQPEIPAEWQPDATDVWQSKVICTRKYRTDGMVG